MRGTLTMFTLAMFFACATCYGAVNNGPGFEMSIFPQSDTIYIGEKTVIHSKLRFDKPVYHNVTLTLYPSLDGPDFIITKVTKVKLGSSLRASGSLEPILDFNTRDLPGNALSCQFNLGTVTQVEFARTPEDYSLIVEMDAKVPEERDEGVGPGHHHDLGASIGYGNSEYKIVILSSTFRARSLPLLFKSRDRKLKQGKQVKEMEANSADQIHVQYQ